MIRIEKTFIELAFLLLWPHFTKHVFRSPKNSKTLTKLISWLKLKARLQTTRASQLRAIDMTAATTSDMTYTSNNRDQFFLVIVFWVAGYCFETYSKTRRLLTPFPASSTFEPYHLEYDVTPVTCFMIGISIMPKGASIAMFFATQL